MDKNKVTYYFGMGLGFGSLFGGLFSTIFGKYILVLFFGGIVLGGLIGFLYGKSKIGVRNKRFLKRPEKRNKQNRI